jgi:hypothetical protein
MLGLKDTRMTKKEERERERERETARSSTSVTRECIGAA